MAQTLLAVGLAPASHALSGMAPASLTAPGASHVTVLV